MATKINPDFYGAESTFVPLYTDLVKTSQYTIANLISNGTYTGGDLDHTATPWGIARSSVSSDFQSQLTKGATWTIFENKNQRKNTPLWFYYTASPVDGTDNPADIVGTGATSTTYARALYKNRYSPAVTVDGNNIKSSLTVDNNENVQLTNTNTLKPVTYLNYSGIRICLRYVYYKTRGEGDFKRTSFVNFYNNNVNANRVFGFDFTIRDKAGNILPIYVSIGGSALDIPEVYKQSYYSDSNDKWVRPWRSINSIGYWNMASLSWTLFNTDTGCIYSSVFDTLNSDDNAVASMGSCGWGHLSDKPQVFDDISYHWTYGYSPITAEEWVQNPIHTGDAFTSGVYRSFAQLDLDDGVTLNNDNFCKAIMHEIAFLGLPFCFGSEYANAEIGSNNLYLPVFDEHLVTTGEYLNGTASLDLPNASWTDVFSTGMPEYDPEYEPDEPIPSGDYGDTSNTGSARATFPNGFKVYLMSANTYYQFLQAINSYYNDKTPDDWTVDFQGVNPSDYILNCYNTKLALPHSATGEPIKIGNITLSVSAYTLSQTDESWCTFNFGTRTIKPRYNDFRDYAPYTSVELYLPLAGTVALDTNYCMGHNITVKYYYDVLTMSCVAAVYRDNMLYKCSDCKIGAEIPLLSSNMGAYQNQIEQLSVARQRNNIAIATSATAAIAGTTAAIATGSPMAIIGAVGGFSKLADNINESNNLDYQFDHIAPSVSTTGASDPQNNLCVGQLKPKLIIKRPVMLSGRNDTVYSKTVGNACCINDYIGSRSGLVVCSNINANDIVNAYGESPTADEINSIKQAFSTGVYV